MHADAAFVHRLHRPDDPDGSTLVLLHGTGGNEDDLLPFGHQVAPRAALLGVRGRSTDEGAPRWFRRLNATRFDQAHVKAEAEAFAAFLPAVFRAHNLDQARATFIGYSNGANFIAAVMLLHPNLVRRAALLRPMLVLDDPPAPSLTGADVLAVAGESDPYGRFAPALEQTLGRLGAHVDARVIRAGHELTADDLRITQAWFAGA